MISKSNAGIILCKNSLKEFIGQNYQSLHNSSIISSKNFLANARALVIHDVPDEDIVAGVPAKSIKDKVISDKLFLMAGQEQKQQLKDKKAEQSSAQSLTSGQHVLH